MDRTYNDPFAVVLFRHASSSDSVRRLAEALDAWLTDLHEHSLLAPGSNLPTYSYTEPRELSALAAGDRRVGERVAGIILVDDALVRAEAWRSWIAAIPRRPQPLQGAFRPIFAVVDPTVAERLAVISAAADDPVDAPTPSDAALLRITARLLDALPPCARLGSGADRLLVSYDRAAIAPAGDAGTGDGDTAEPPQPDPSTPLEALRRAFSGLSQRDRHFAAIDGTPPRGSEQGVATLRRATVVALHTDGYCDDPLGVDDLLAAKALDRPLVVVDASERRAFRTHRHLGNLRAIRWRATDEAPDDSAFALSYRVLAHAARETLIHRHTQLLFDALRRAALLPAAITLTRPPELAALADLAPFPRRSPQPGPEIIVYPDPPLPRAELELLRRFIDAEFRSLTQALATSSERERPLLGVRVALSISESPDLADHGRTPAHVDRAWIALARHLLDAGASLAYGGDLRRRGFTVALAALRDAYADVQLPVRAEAIRAYLAWPHRPMDAGDDVTPGDGFKAVRIEPPSDVDPALTADDLEATPEGRVARSRALTAMRHRMAKETHARILLGGQFQGGGVLPGLLEEALLHLDQGKPIYVIGAYGGLARAVADALEGRRPAALTDDFQLSAAGREPPELRRDTRDLYDARARQRGLAPIDLAALVDKLAHIGVAGLHNGLSPAENRRLFTSPSLFEQTSLVLRGLRAS